MSYWQQKSNWPRDPEHKIVLGRAADQIGEALYGSRWTGTEFLPAANYKIPKPIETTIQRAELHERENRRGRQLAELVDPNYASTRGPIEGANDIVPIWPETGDDIPDLMLAEQSITQIFQRPLRIKAAPLPPGPGTSLAAIAALHSGTAPAPNAPPVSAPNVVTAAMRMTAYEYETVRNWIIGHANDSAARVRRGDDVKERLLTLLVKGTIRAWCGRGYGGPYDREVLPELWSGHRSFIESRFTTGMMDPAAPNQPTNIRSPGVGYICFVKEGIGLLQKAIAREQNPGKPKGRKPITQAAEQEYRKRLANGTAKKIARQEALHLQDWEMTTLGVKLSEVPERDTLERMIYRVRAELGS